MLLSSRHLEIAAVLGRQFNVKPYFLIDPANQNIVVKVILQQSHPKTPFHILVFSSVVCVKPVSNFSIYERRPNMRLTSSSFESIYEASQLLLVEELYFPVIIQPNNVFRNSEGFAPSFVRPTNEISQNVSTPISRFFLICKRHHREVKCSTANSKMIYQILRQCKPKISESRYIFNFFACSVGRFMNCKAGMLYDWFFSLWWWDYYVLLRIFCWRRNEFREGYRELFLRTLLGFRFGLSASEETDYEWATKSCKLLYIINENVICNKNITYLICICELVHKIS